MKRVPFFLVALAFMVADGAANAVPITTGAITQVAPPASVAPGVTQSDTNILLFQEQESLELLLDVSVEVSTPSMVTGAGGTTPGVISSGTIVDVFLLHFDAVTAGAVILDGTVNFDQEILGIILFGASLDDTDGILGFPGTLYPTPGDFFRGTAEAGVGVDEVTLSNDLRTVSVLSRVTGGGQIPGIDQMRLFTAAVVCQNSAARDTA